MNTRGNGNKPGRLPAAKAEKVLRVISLLATMRDSAKENSRMARDAGTRSYCEGLVFAWTIAHREVEGLLRK